MIFCRKLAKITCLVVVLVVASLFQVSVAWGTKMCFFSGVCMAGPLLGAFFGLGGVGSVIVFSKITRFFLFGSIPVISTGVPTFLASCCWSVTSRMGGVVVKVFVPLICFVLFIFHASVGNGWWYGLYWFVPVVFYFTQLFGLLKKTVFVTALQSTFVAHAVGSIIWCYTIPMSPEKWLALIPLVFVERLVIASGMVLLFKVATYSFWSSIVLLPISLFLRSGEGFWNATFGHDYGRQPSVGKGKEIAGGNTWSS